MDIGRVNDRFFVNVTSGGFGAEVTANTPPGLKRALGGAAYSLMGVITAAKMSPYRAVNTSAHWVISDMIRSREGEEKQKVDARCLRSDTGRRIDLPAPAGR